MVKELFYTAVDMGSSKVCTIIARVGTEGELKVLGTGVAPSQGIQKGRIENIEEVKKAIHFSLEEAQRYIGRGIITGVYGVISGTHTSCMNTKDVLEGVGDLGSVTAEQVHRLIQSSFPKVDRSQEVLHVIPMGYEVDGLSGVRNPTGLHANQIELETHIVMGDAVTIKNTVKAVEANKVKLNGMVLHSLASAEATLSGDEREMGAVLVDIGSGTTDLAIYRQGSPWYSAVIPVGGSHMSRDLAVAARIPFPMAEEIKVKWGNVMPELVGAEEEVVIPSFQSQPRRVVKRRALCEPLYIRAVELLKMIMLRVTQAGLRQLPIGGLVITGGCAEMQGLQALAEKTLGGPVRIAQPDGIAGLPTQLMKPGFSAAVGTLLWGIKHQGEKRPYSNAERTLWGPRFFAQRFGRAKVGASR